MRRRGVPTTVPEATALDLAARLPGDEAVVAVDRVLAGGLVDLAPLRARAAAGTGRGSARARAVCALADERAESPPETRLRLLVVRSGLPAPVPQFTVRQGGRFVARVDLGWPDLCVAVEYDGAWRAEPGQFARDRRRLNALQAAGRRVVFVTARDLGRPTSSSPASPGHGPTQRVCGHRALPGARDPDGRTVGRAPRYSQPLRLKPRYSRTQATTITSSTIG